MKRTPTSGSIASAKRPVRPRQTMRRSRRDQRRRTARSPMRIGRVDLHALTDKRERRRTVDDRAQGGAGRQRSEGAAPLPFDSTGEKGIADGRRSVPYEQGSLPQQRHAFAQIARLRFTRCGICEGGFEPLRRARDPRLAGGNGDLARARQRATRAAFEESAEGPTH